MKLLEKIALGVTPDLYVPFIYNINFNSLKEKNIKGIILDLDNTMLPWKDYNVPKINIDWVEKGKSLGFKFIILSNTIHTKRLAHISEVLGCDYIHPAFKPYKRNYYKAAKKLNLQYNEMACVGDQLFTDIKGGNKAGFFTVLVDPLSEKEFKGTKISRFFEKIIKNFIKAPL